MVATHEYEVVIVGAGPAGMCAGLYTGRSMLRSVVLERGFPGGELLNTEVIEDYIGFEHVLGHELATKFQAHAEKFGAEIRTSTPVESVTRRADGQFDCVTESGEVFVAPTVIVTAGGTPVKLDVHGEIEYAGKGVSYCAICDGAFYKGHTILVVGGGDAACEEADFLTRYAEKVYLVHRRDTFRASKLVQQRAFANPKIEVITDANMMTSIEGLFAAGDVRAQLTRQVTTAVGDATTAAIGVEKYLTARKSGQPAPKPQPMLVPSA